MANLTCAKARRSVSNLDIAFGGDIQHLMPPADRIPPEFGLYKEVQHWANGLFSRLFHRGGSVAHLVAKPGIDRVKATFCPVGKVEGAAP